MASDASEAPAPTIPTPTASPSNQPEQPTQENVPTPVNNAPVATNNENVNLFDDFNTQSEPTKMNNQPEVPTTNGGANLLDEFDLLGGGRNLFKK